MKKRDMVMLLMLAAASLAACGKAEGFSADAADLAEHGSVDEGEVLDPEGEKLKGLREAPSVWWASIEYRPTDSSDWGEELYRIELEDAVAMVKLYGEEEKTYPLDDGQVEGVRRLLSEYALTIYEGEPYWPTGDYCTMVELFDFWINYDGGNYHETGAMRYPEGWDGFMEELRELIME